MRCPVPAKFLIMFLIFLLEADLSLLRMGFSLPDPDSRSPGCRRTEGPLLPSLLTLCLTLLLLPSSSASGSSAASGVGTPCRRFSASGSHGTSGCRGVATRVLDVF